MRVLVAVLAAGLIATAALLALVVQIVSWLTKYSVTSMALPR